MYQGKVWQMLSGAERASATIDYMIVYIALLRGVNVGGKNRVPMAELKACFERVECAHVQTYIQSGNVLFRSAESTIPTLAARLEMALSATFGYQARVVVLAAKQLAGVLEDAPKGFGADTIYRYNVIFLREPLTAAEALAVVKAREGVDGVAAGSSVLYFWTRIEAATKSWLPKIVGTPPYQNMTIRNWNTTKKLYDLSQALERA